MANGTAQPQTQSQALGKAAAGMQPQSIDHGTLPNSGAVVGQTYTYDSCYVQYHPGQCSTGMCSGVFRGTLSADVPLDSRGGAICPTCQPGIYQVTINGKPLAGVFDFVYPSAGSNSPTTRAPSAPSVPVVAGGVNPLPSPHPNVPPPANPRPLGGFYQPFEERPIIVADPTKGPGMTMPSAPDQSELPPSGNWYPNGYNGGDDQSNQANAGGPGQDDGNQQASNDQQSGDNNSDQQASNDQQSGDNGNQQASNDQQSGDNGNQQASNDQQAANTNDSNTQQASGSEGTQQTGGASQQTSANNADGSGGDSLVAEAKNFVSSNSNTISAAYSESRGIVNDPSGWAAEKDQNFIKQTTVDTAAQEWMGPRPAGGQEQTWYDGGKDLLGQGYDNVKSGAQGFKQNLVDQYRQLINSVGQTRDKVFNFFQNRVDEFQQGMRQANP
jgi:hypothetical protein